MALPTLERRQLGAELRRLREAAGKQQKEAAAAIECDISQVSRVERGERAFKALEIEALLDYYSAPAHSREKILDLARISRQRIPRRMYSDALPGAFRRLSDHEQDATEIYYADNELVPGLLQTEHYIRALMRPGRPDIFAASRDDLEERVQFRLERQELIHSANPPLIRFVLGESALHRPIGGAAVLRQQLVHLVDVIEHYPAAVIQVAPLSVTDHPLLGGPMQLLRFGGVAPDIVHQPTYIGGGVYITDEHDVLECSRSFDRLRAVALGPEESRLLIAQRVEGLQS